MDLCVCVLEIGGGDGHGDIGESREKGRGKVGRPGGTRGDLSVPEFRRTSFGSIEPFRGNKGYRLQWEQIGEGQGGKGKRRG